VEVEAGAAAAKIRFADRELEPSTGEEMMMSSPSDAEVIGRSLVLLRFLGRRAGATIAEGVLGELFRIAFERRKTFDASRASALP
jgi:hypothetical protein